MQTVLRVDAPTGELLRPVRTDEGYIHAEGIAARTGVLVYRLDDGGTLRELIPPEELFDSKSLESRAHKPITNDHPASGAVTPDTWRTDAGGVTHTDVHADAAGGFARIRVTLHRRDLIDAAERGKAELSDGKSVLLDQRSGLWDATAQAYQLDGEDSPVYWPDEASAPERFNPSRAERFDAIQRQIRINHHAIVDAARAGNMARLRLDSSGNTIPVSGSTPTPKRTSMDTVQMQFGDISLEVPARVADAVSAERKAHAEALEKAKQETKTDAEDVEPTEAQIVEAVKQRCDAETWKDLKVDDESLGKLIESIASLKTRADQASELKAKLDEAEKAKDLSPSERHQIYADRAPLVQTAQQLKLDQGEEPIKLADLDEDALRRQILAAVYKDDAEDVAKIAKEDAAYIRFRFDEFRKRLGKVGSGDDAIRKLVGDAAPAPTGRRRMDQAESNYLGALSGATA